MTLEEIIARVDSVKSFPAWLRDGLLSLKDDPTGIMAQANLSINYDRLHPEMSDAEIADHVRFVSRVSQIAMRVLSEENQ